MTAPTSPVWLDARALLEKLRDMGNIELDNAYAARHGGTKPPAGLKREEVMQKILVAAYPGVVWTSLSPEYLVEEQVSDVDADDEDEELLPVFDIKRIMKTPSGGWSASFEFEGSTDEVKAAVEVVMNLIQTFTTNEDHLQKRPRDWRTSVSRTHTEHGTVRVNFFVVDSLFWLTAELRDLHTKL
jgi:hypothetical protein